MANELYNEIKKDEDVFNLDAKFKTAQSYIPGNGGLVSTVRTKEGDFLDYTVGALTNARLKTYFNIHFPFTLWTGVSLSAPSTEFVNWSRTGTDVTVRGGGAFATILGTGDDSIILDTPFYTNNAAVLAFSNTNTIIMDWWAQIETTVGDIQMGFGSESASFVGPYNATTNNRVTFGINNADGLLYAIVGRSAAPAGSTQQDISSGIDLTVWNNYRIEIKLGTSAKFYVNSILKATFSGGNLPTAGTIGLGFGRDGLAGSALFSFTAPNISLEMNP